MIQAIKDWQGNPRLISLLPSYVFKSLHIFPGTADGNPAEYFTLDAKITVKSANDDAVDDFILSDDYFSLLKSVL